MKLGVVLVPALAFVGCGAQAPAPRSAPESQPIAVEPPPDPAEGADPDVIEDSGDSRSDRAQSLASCAESLRRTPGVAATSEEAEHYDQAYAHEQRGELAEARRGYFEIIQNSPKSGLVPVVYLAFAELFAKEASDDASKWELALMAYREVLKYPPPANPVWEYATLRSADVERARGDHQQALAGYVKVVAAVRERPETRCATQLSVEAKRGAVIAYAEVGQPAKAYQFFRRSDPEGSDLWLADLVAELMRRGRSKEACAAAHAGPESARIVLERSACP